MTDPLTTDPTSTLTGTTRVVAAVIRRGERYLVGQRPAHKRHGGLWEFPGGKLLPGESVLDGVRRELAEELGLAVVTVGATLFRRQDPGSPFLIEFVEAEAAGEPVATEHAALAWLAVRELPSVPLAPTDAAFVAHLQPSETPACSS